MQQRMMEWRRLLSTRRLGHRGAEPVTAARNPFQKDWDRIVFCSAFRRLQDKTQVHSLVESDYVRTRLTHSMEVSSVGRSLGAAVGQTVAQRHLAGDSIGAAEFGHIVSAACLAHDIGNPPFGHFGEDMIRTWFAGPGSHLLQPLRPAERADLLRFEGNAQGFRVLTRLQNWRNAGGLRLTCATLATFAKYPHGALAADGALRDKFGFFQAERASFAEVAAEVGLLADGNGWRRHPLAFLVEAADDICYRVVDLEDGYKLGRIEFAAAETHLRDLIGSFPPRYREIEEPGWRIAYLRAKAIGRLIEDCAASFLDDEPAIMAGRRRGDLLSQTRSSATLRAIETLTREQIFQSRERHQNEIQAREILTLLLDRSGHAETPPTAEDRYTWLLSVTDYISGMTDSYAVAQAKRLRG